MNAPRLGLGRLAARLTSPEAAVFWGEPLFRVLGMRANPPVETLAEVRHILVVRLDEIGDLVLCTPLLRELRRNCPAARIALAVKPGVRNLIEKCPYIDEIFEFDGRMKSPRVGRIARHLRTLNAGRKLRRRGFDLAINPRRDIDYANGNALAYWSGAARRIGYREAGADKRNPYLTQELANPLASHEVEANLDVLRSLGGSVHSDSLELWRDADDERAVDKLFAEHGIAPGEPLMALAPGAGAPMRVWPADRFKELADEVALRWNLRSLVIGSPAETSTGRVIATASNAVDSTGRLTLRQTVAALARCRVFVGNDSGPLHMAAAVKTPVVEISSFGRDGRASHANSPHRFGPWQVAATVLQPEHPLPPCRDGCEAASPHCILRISVAEVVAAVATRLQGEATQCAGAARGTEK